MIFKIDKSCLNAINNKDRDSIIALDDLASSRRKGKNFIFAEKSVLETLYKADISKGAKEVFKSLFNNSSEDKLYWQTVNKYINVVDKVIEPQIEKIGDAEELKVELKSLKDSDIHDYTLLITENQSDCEFYKLIGQYYARSKNIVRTKIMFDLKPGGGDTTVNILSLTVNNETRKLCLCIVDSDKKFPKDTGGSTKEHIKNFIKKHPVQDIWKVIILDVHEIENLLPISYIEKCSKDIRTSSNTIKFLKDLIDSEAIFYFDMKDGIKKEKFICKDFGDPTIKKKFYKNENFRSYWEEYVKNYVKDMKNIQDEHIINGFGKKILERIIKEFSSKEISLEEDGYLKGKWISLGRDIFSWGCVGDRILIKSKSTIINQD